MPPPQTETWYPAIPQDPAGEAAQPPNSSPKCFTFRRHTRILESVEVTTNFDADLSEVKVESVLRSSCMKLKDGR